MATRSERGHFTGHRGPGDGTGFQKTKTHARPELALGPAAKDVTGPQGYPMMRKTHPHGKDRR